MAISDAKPVPIKNEPYRLTFEIKTSNNLPHTSWSNPIAFLSLDCSTFYDHTNACYFASAPTQMGSYGVGYVDITASGMNSDLVTVLIHSNSGTSYYWAQEFIYPEEPGDYRCNLVQVNGLDIVDDGVVEANLVEIDGDPVDLVTTNEMASAVWDISLDQHHADGSTGMALITASGNLISGDWSTHSANDIWTQSNRSLTDLGGGAVSGDVAGAVWTALQDDYDHVSDSFGDYLDYEITKVATDDEVLASQIAIQSDIAAMSGSILDANIVQVSGINVTLADLQSSSDISTSGFATRSQLEYWGLVILNNCGGGPVG